MTLHRELSSWDALNFLFSGALGTALAVVTLAALKNCFDAAMDLRKHYVRAHTAMARAPSRTQLRKGKAPKGPAARQWWRNARKFRSAWRTYTSDL